MTENRQILLSNNVISYKSPIWQISYGNRSEQANIQDPSNNTSVIDYKVLMDERKKRPIHNMKYQLDKRTADGTTQLDPYNNKLELPVEHGQIYHIGIPKSKPTIYTNSLNKSKSSINTFSSILCISSRSNKSQTPI